jgi:hypothetical protein
MNLTFEQLAQSIPNDDPNKEILLLIAIMAEMGELVQKFDEIIGKLRVAGESRKGSEKLKIPKARKLPSGMWFIQLRLDGESIPVTALTEKACENEARYIKAEYKANKRILKTAGVTLRQAMEKYISARDKILSPSTIRGYEAIKKNGFR